MNKRIALPFLTLSEPAIEAGPWFLAFDQDDWIEAGDFLEDWDSASAIRIKREIKLNHDIASSELGINADELSLSLGIRVGTGSGRLPRQIILQECQKIRSTEQQIIMEQKIPGNKLSVVLDVVVEVTLAALPSKSNPLSPTRIGDKVWHDKHRIRLEGEEPRFPIEVVDLRSILGDVAAGCAPWHLHWSPRDWARDFHGAIRLFLNAEHPEIIERITTQDATTLQALMADVMSQVCERFLNEPEAYELVSQFEPGSLGARAIAWLKEGWPNRDFGSIHSILENRPGDFRSTFLALAETQEE